MDLRFPKHVAGLDFIPEVSEDKKAKVSIMARKISVDHKLIFAGQVSTELPAAKGQTSYQLATWNDTVFFVHGQPLPFLPLLILGPSTPRLPASLQVRGTTRSAAATP
eukprot:342647-Pyramimonas_sp.AAC.1